MGICGRWRRNHEPPQVEDDVNKWFDSIIRKFLFIKISLVKYIQILT